MHVGDGVCAGLLPTLLPLGSFLEAAQSSVPIKMRPDQRLSWGDRRDSLAWGAGSLLRAQFRANGRRSGIADAPFSIAGIWEN